MSAPSAADARWILFVGSDTEALARAAERELSPPVISAPEPMPISAHELPPPGIKGPRTLYLPRLDRALFENMGAATTLVYLLAKLTQLASEGEALGVVATALEPGAKDLLAGRGLASRFEIRRVPGKASTEEEAPKLDVGDETALGKVFLAASRPAEAVPTLRRAIDLDPELPAAHYELGKALILADDIVGAVEAFRRTTELLPEYASAWANLGAALGEMQRLDDAAKALEQAVALDPKSHVLHSNLGVAYRDQGRLDEAEAELRKCVALAPEFVFGYYNLASVQFLQGLYDEAIECFENARRLDPRGSPRQSLILAVTRLAAGDAEAAFQEYRNVFERLEGPMKRDMKAVAEWDLEQLATRIGVTPDVKAAVALLRSFGIQ